MSPGLFVIYPCPPCLCWAGPHTELVPTKMGAYITEMYVSLNDITIHYTIHEIGSCIIVVLAYSNVAISTAQC